MKLSPDFHELLECFARHDVRYLVIGGWALAAHGVPRMTKDLDLWVLPESANATAVLSALEGLKANKRLTGRSQDLVDVETLGNEYGDL